MGRTGVRNSIAGCVFVRPSRNDAVSVTQPYAPLVTGPSSVRSSTRQETQRRGPGWKKGIHPGPGGGAPTTATGQVEAVPPPHIRRGHYRGRAPLASMPAGSPSGWRGHHYGRKTPKRGKSVDIVNTRDRMGFDGTYPKNTGI